MFTVPSILLIARLLFDNTTLLSVVVAFELFNSIAVLPPVIVTLSALRLVLFTSVKPLYLALLAPDKSITLSAGFVLKPLMLNVPAPVS